MRPALRIPGDTNGASGSFASYAELADDRDVLTARLDAAKDDLALALGLLDDMAGMPPCRRYNAVCEAHQQWDLPMDDSPCPDAEAHELLVRYGIRTTGDAG